MVVLIYMGLGKTQRNKREIFLPDNRNNHNNETAITYTIHVLQKSCISQIARSQNIISKKEKSYVKPEY